MSAGQGDADAESGSFSQTARGGPSLERVLTMEPETALEAGKRPRALPDGESSEGRVLRRRVYAATFGEHGPETRTRGLGGGRRVDGRKTGGRHGAPLLGGILGGMCGREMVLVLMDITEQTAACEGLAPVVPATLEGTGASQVCTADQTRFSRAPVESLAKSPSSHQNPVRRRGKRSGRWVRSADAPRRASISPAFCPQTDGRPSTDTRANMPVGGRDSGPACECGRRAVYGDDKSGGMPSAFCICICQQPCA